MIYQFLPHHPSFPLMKLLYRNAVEVAFLKKYLRNIESKRIIFSPKKLTDFYPISNHLVIQLTKKSSKAVSLSICIKVQDVYSIELLYRLVLNLAKVKHKSLFFRNQIILGIRLMFEILYIQVTASDFYLQICLSVCRPVSWSVCPKNILDIFKTRFHDYQIY